MAVALVAAAPGDAPEADAEPEDEGADLDDEPDARARPH